MGGCAQASLKDSKLLAWTETVKIAQLLKENTKQHDDVSSQ